MPRSIPYPKCIIFVFTVTHDLDVNLPSGFHLFRLLKYNPDENTVQVVVKNLHFPNGVCLSEDNSYLLVAETPRYRIMK